jgi:hypothetical protein
LSCQASGAMLWSPKYARDGAKIAVALWIKVQKSEI